MGMDDLEPIGDIEAHGEPATPDALRSIVARHQRARTRALGIALAVALVAGPVAGWVVARSGENGGQKVAIGGGSPTTTGPAPELSSGGAYAIAQTPGIPGGPDLPPAHHLFTRTTADGITVRAYRTDPPTPPIGASPSTTVAPKASPSTTIPPKNGSAEAFSCVGTAPAPVLGKPVPPEAGNSSSSGSDQPSNGASGSGGSVSSGSASAFASSGASSSANANSSSPSGTATASPRATASPLPPCPPPSPFPCQPTPVVLAELSNEAAVGQGFVPLVSATPTPPLFQVVTGMFGIAESSPAMWVAVQSGPGVKTVRLRLPSGVTDQMAPVDGVAVLAAGTPSPPPEGILEALDASGKVIGTQDVNQPRPGPAPGPRPMIACAFASGGSSRSGAGVSSPSTTR
jgi:hypothetical protein